MTPFCEKCWGYHEPREACTGVRAVEPQCGRLTEPASLRAEVERLQGIVDRTRPARTLQAIVDLVNDPMECGHHIENWDEERDLCVWCELNRLTIPQEEGPHE